MRAINLFLVMVFVFSINIAASECSESAKIVMPSIGSETKADFEEKLREAKAAHLKNERDADALIWYGRRTAYLGDYRRAIHIFSEGIKMHPRDARMFRHRGHRFISIRCFDDAISDFEKAANLIDGKPDEVEPDGLPNAKNIPTSTLQSNIWYHLGLAYYLKGDFENALRAYKECLKVSKNPDMLVATTNWLYVTLRRLGNEKEAAAILEPITSGLDVIENDGYYDLLKLYKGELTQLDLAGKNGDDLSSATALFGIGNLELIHGHKYVARLCFEKVLQGNQWSSFAYIAAEAELGRLSNR